MPRRQYKVPFAATGDTAVVPTAIQPDGSVSYQQGYGPDYQREYPVDPLAKVFPRDVHNGLLNELTASVGEIQQNGFAIWVVEGAPYPINSAVRHNNTVWISTIDNNNDEPGGPGITSWSLANLRGSDALNTLRIDVASASNINLTASAPNTRHINITGNTTINGFTVSAGQCFFVRFNSALTLTNSASLVTNSGANITVAAGDTCIIRATAENTVEVLCGDFLSEATPGTRGQTWQSVTRVLGTNYTNTTGRIIILSVSLSMAAGIELAIVIDGLQVARVNNGTAGTASFFVTSVIPSGSVYSITGTGTLQARELR